MNNAVSTVKKLKDKAVRFFNPADLIRLTQYGAMAAVSLSAMPMIAYAGADDMMGTLIGYVCKIFFYIGALLMVWGIGQLVLAFKNEDADSKSRAMMVLVCAILLMSVGGIYDAVAGKATDGNAPNRDTSVTI